MNLNPIETHFLNLPELSRDTILALRQTILQYNKDINEVFRYSMPFYCFKKQRICYLWLDKKSGYPYIGFVDGNLMNHPLLIQGDRKRMKILNINPSDDLPLATIHELLDMAIEVLNP